MRIGRYECIGELAAGGMGTVYLARVCGEGGFERLVALKVMHAHLEKDDQFRSMFLDEARLAAMIRHPNVVSTVDVQRSPEGLFLVMDYVEGPSLNALRKRFTRAGVPIPLGVVLRVLCDVLGGLQAAHELCDVQGRLLEIVHRDVTPQNILIGTDGVARLTDFGVARAATQTVRTETGQIKGKLAYMPPEQFAGVKVDVRCDVYAAGVTLWEALANERMFVAENQVALMTQVVGGDRKRPTDDTTRVPESILEVCMRAVAVDPDKRPDTAADFAADLERAAAESGVAIATHQEVALLLAEHQDVWLSAKELRQNFNERSAQRSPVANSGLTAAAVVQSTATYAGLSKTSRVRMALVGAGCLVLGATASALVAGNEPDTAKLLRETGYPAQAAAALRSFGAGQAPVSVESKPEAKSVVDGAPKQKKRPKKKRPSAARRMRTRRGTEAPVKRGGAEYRPSGL